MLNDRAQYRRIWVAGHRGLVGSAVLSRLAREGTEVLTVGREDLDLCDHQAVRSWLEEKRPDAIVIAAAKVGGILANDTYPADFLTQNLLIQSNIITNAHTLDVERVLFLGSSCVYPKHAEQPIREDALLSGPLEPTNEWYAIAKIAGLKMCQAYARQFGRRYDSVMPCNVYGPRDNFDPYSSHVIPALIRKFHEAKRRHDGAVVLWGTGSPLREFIFSEDLADAIVHVLFRFSEGGWTNCGSGREVSILELAKKIAGITGFQGRIEFDSSKPDGTPRKILDSSKLRSLGWTPETELDQGLLKSYRFYIDTLATQ